MSRNLVKKEDIEKVVLELVKTVNSIVDAIDASSQTKRSEWMKKIVPSISNINPGYNVVVCHVGWEWKGKGMKAILHDEVSGYFGLKHYQFDILIFKEGKFTKNGDGGWLNWGYVGANVTRNGDTLDFKPSENRSLEEFDDGVDAEEESNAEGSGVSPEEDENAWGNEDRSLEETEFTIEDEYDGSALTLGA